jgi:hypothetical protein
MALYFGRCSTADAVVSGLWLQLCCLGVIAFFGFGGIVRKALSGRPHPASCGTLIFGGSVGVQGRVISHIGHSLPNSSSKPTPQNGAV